MQPGNTPAATGPGLPPAREAAPPEHLVTPEAVTVTLATGGLGTRTAAFLLDWMLASMITYLVVWLASIMVVVGDQAGLPTWVGVVVVIVATFAVPLGYFVGQETLWRGRTVGKLALGLRVVTREGGQIRLRHALIRGVFAVVELWGLLGIPALVSVFTTRNNQRLGDLVAGTIVLRTAESGQQLRPVWFPPPPGLEPYVEALDTTRITPGAYRTVRELLVRANNLSGPARKDLFTRLAATIADRVEPSPPSGVPADVFLRAVAAAYQQRQRNVPGGTMPGVPVPTPGWGPMPPGAVLAPALVGHQAVTPTASWGPPITPVAQTASWGPPITPVAQTASWGPPITPVAPLPVDEEGHTGPPAGGQVPAEGVTPDQGAGGYAPPD